MQVTTKNIITVTLSQYMLQLAIKFPDLIQGNKIRCFVCKFKVVEKNKKNEKKVEKNIKLQLVNNIKDFWLLSPKKLFNVAPNKGAKIIVNIKKSVVWKIILKNLFLMGT